MACCVNTAGRAEEEPAAAALAPVSERAGCCGRGC